MTSLETDFTLSSELSSPKGCYRHMDIGNSFRNFHSCLEWDQFSEMEGKFVTKKSTDPIPPDIQKLQMKFGFQPGEPITKFNVGRIIPSMVRYEPRRKFFSPRVSAISNRRFSSPGLGLDLRRRKIDASFLRKNADNSATLSKGDGASLKMNQKLSNSANARMSDNDFAPENTSTPKNKNMISLETGLRLSSSRNKRSFPQRRESLQPRRSTGILKEYLHNQLNVSDRISKEYHHNRLSASSGISKQNDHNQLPASAEIPEDHRYIQLTTSDRILKEHHHNRLSASAGISKERHCNQLTASDRILKE